MTSMTKEAEQTRDTSQDDDKFGAMVSAKARVNLPISDFEPRSMLKTAVTEVLRPRFPALDYHNHLDALEPDAVLRIMDECGLEHIVNITMKVGAEAFAVMDRFAAHSERRFSTIGWMGWNGIEKPDFFRNAVDYLERLVEHGAVGFKIWKDLGLTVREANGEVVRIDDERLDPLFDKARELSVPIMFHTADPFAFFEPIDRFNERYEELAAHPDWGFHGAQYSKHELLEQRNTVFARHPGTQFIGAHIGECAEDLGFVSAMLDRFPNVAVDLSARVGELGRQPYSAREFFLKFADRILFGADLLPDVAMYRLYYRFLETADEYFDYPSHASRQGRWMVYGIFLPDDVLRKIYRENALRFLPGLK
jgi:predicted TIM-barrel fold metal-dependent hydrolase